MAWVMLQNTILQMKEATDRTVGVIDTSGTVCACTDPSLKGSLRDDALSALEEMFGSFLVYDGYTYKPVSAPGARFEYVVFVSGEDEYAKSLAIMAALAVGNAKRFYDEKHDRTTFIKNIILDNILSGDIYMKANELRMAIRTARNTLNLFKAIHSTNDNIYLLYEDYEQINDIYQDLLSEVETLEESELKLYMRALFNDFVAFAELMRLYSPDTEGEERVLFADKLIEDSESVIADCDAITNANSADNKQFCWLLRSYMYRGMFCALEEKKRLAEIGEVELNEDADALEAKMKEYLRLSLEERTQLYREYQDGNVNGIFFENVEMEYYLALAEYYPYETDKIKKVNYSRKLKGYVEKTKRIENEKNVFIRKILGYIERS